MKLIIIVVAILLLVGLGGGAAYVTLFEPSDEAPAVVEAPKPDPANFASVELAPMMVPLTSSRHTAVGVKLTVVDKAVAQQAGGQLPRLRDAFLNEFYAVADRRGRAAGVRDIEAIQIRLLEKARNILGDAVVVDVSVAEVTGLPAPTDKKPPPEKKSGGHH